MRRQNPTFRRMTAQAVTGLLLLLPAWGLQAEYRFSEAGPWYDKARVIPGERRAWNLNQDWYYLEENHEKPSDLPSIAVAWEDLDLPHTWNALDATDNLPGYRRDASWYRKDISFPRLKSGRWILVFEGINTRSSIYLNGRHIGGHLGGYVAFETDISDHIQRGRNILLIRADNSIDPNIIPSQKSDFAIFGGITRDVWLLYVPDLHLQDIRLQHPNVSHESADNRLFADVLNSGRSADAEIRAQILDPEGRTVSSYSEKLHLKEGLNQLEIDLPATPEPLLWSPEHPLLYDVMVTLESEEGSDSMHERTGYRFYEFREHGAFYLNGERLLLKGTHRHEDWAGLGNALPDSLHRRDMQMMKEMGANFVRLAHYPQDPEIYRAADELGLLLWDELPWCRGGMGGQVWKDNTTRLFREQILQNMNHPSIILWSVGNELYWIPDFEGGGQPDSLNAMVRQLNDLAHSLDPTRLTAMRKYYDGADITDVFSPSIWAGWYSGVYVKYETAVRKAIADYPRFFHAEYGGSSHVGRHSENPIDGRGLVNENEWDEQPNMINVKKISDEGDWSENYIVDLFDWHLMTMEAMPDLSGAAQWAFKDFPTPLRPENPIPYMNQKGLVDREGRPKDAYYVFKSYWTTDPVFCYIESPSWTERHGRPGEMKPVSVFSNAKTVQLFLNGQDMGLKTRDVTKFPAAGLSWDLLPDTGLNTLEARVMEEESILAEHRVEFSYSTNKPGRPERIRLHAETLDNGRVRVHAAVVDAEGAVCYDFNRRVYFDLNGGGTLMRSMGTPNGSQVIEFASGKAAVDLIPEAGKRAVFEARTQDFKGDYLILDWRDMK